MKPKPLVIDLLQLLIIRDSEGLIILLQIMHQLLILPANLVVFTIIVQLQRNQPHLIGPDMHPGIQTIQLHMVQAHIIVDLHLGNPVIPL